MILDDLRLNQIFMLIFMFSVILFNINFLFFLSMITFQNNQKVKIEL